MFLIMLEHSLIKMKKNLTHFNYFEHIIYP